MDGRECSSAAELARKLEVSRARVSQILGLLQLSPEVVDKIVALGDPLPRPFITERKLRRISGLPPREQMQWIKADLSASV